jgi:hypothetical protein
MLLFVLILIVSVFTLVLVLMLIFLMTVRIAVMGNLSWCLQNASGGRGDDVRSSLLCQLQQFELMHPNNQTLIPTVLQVKQESKTTRKTVNSTINPTYTTLIAHRDPLRCPLVALGMYIHWVFDHFQLAIKHKIDWTKNSSWRGFRLLFGQEPEAGLNSSNHYNVFVQAFAKAGFSSQMKQHLPRHLLGFFQGCYGISADSTEKFGGWNSGRTYKDVYMASFAKDAILATHGYAVHEVYDPLWRKVPVPAAFLKLVCPMVEECLAQVKGEYVVVFPVQMLIQTQEKRTLLVQPISEKWSSSCAQFSFRSVVCSSLTVIFQLTVLIKGCAALYEVEPDSTLFWLPALCNPDVQHWIKNTFPSQYCTLKESHQPVNLACIQDQEMRSTLHRMQSAQEEQNSQMNNVMTTLLRRTVPFSPTQEPATSTSQGNTIMLPPSTIIIPSETPSTPSTYRTANNELRAYASPMPASPSISRPTTQVDLVLPDPLSFAKPGMYSSYFTATDI